MWRGTFVQVNQKPRVQFSVVVLWQSWEYCEAAIAKLSEKKQVFFWKWWWENELLPDQKNYPILGLPALGHWFWPIPGCSSLCRATRRKGFDCWCLSDATWTSFVMVVFQINHVHPSSFWKLYNSSVNMNKYILTKAIYINFNSAQKYLLFFGCAYIKHQGLKNRESQVCREGGEAGETLSKDRSISLRKAKRGFGNKWEMSWRY